MQTQVSHVSKISRFKFLLPLVFVALMGVSAPLPAHAAPRNAGEGMFDCLGEFDWGCKVMSYLFEDKKNGLPSFRTDVSNDGANTNADSTSVQTALRKMMGFFSNAMLVIASLILLYHLIVMVAETAHTGTIGGKETNQLWAPIRLVIAIGLLVPLGGTVEDPTGLNSGQYVILQVAKWGSGLGSQAWKVFTEALAEKQTLVPAITPSVQTLLSEAMNIYACQAAANYYARAMRLPNSAINEYITTTPDSKIYRYSSREEGGDSSCGEIVYFYPVADPTNPATELTEKNSSTFLNMRSTLQAKARDLVERYFVPSVLPTSTPPSVSTLNDMVAQFQEDLLNQIDSISPNIANTKYQQITQAIKNAANEYGWMSAGTWFMAVARAQGQIVSAGIQLPKATSNTETGLLSAADMAYKRYLNWVNNSPDPGVGAGTPSVDAQPLPVPVPRAITGIIRTANGWVIQRFSTKYGNYVREYIKFLNKTPREAGEFIMKSLDETAKHYGLWQWKDNKQPTTAATRVIEINNANPLADLANLGHTHIQVAIDLWGIALIYAAAGAGGDLAFRVMNPRNLHALAPGDTSWIANLVGTVGLTAAFFYASFGVWAIIAGVVLAFLIPLMPFVRFFYAIVTWIATVMEAMFCLPFLALAHLSPKGEGFSGPKPQFGYRMVFQIFVRPSLAVFGLIGSLLIFNVAVRFINNMYFTAVLGVGSFQDGAASILARAIINILYVALVYICANMSFKMIDHIPRRAMQWMGDGAQEEQYHDEQGTLGGVVAQVQQHVNTDLIQAPHSMGSRLRLR